MSARNPGFVFLDSENPSPIGRFAFKPSMAMRLLLNNSDTVELSRADGGCPQTSTIGVRQPAGAPLACSFPREWRTAAPQLLSLVPQARHKRRFDEEAAVGSTSNLPRWCSGSTGVSKTLGGGSIPSRGANNDCLSGVSGLRACLKSRRLPFDSAGRHQNNRAVAERSKASVCKRR